MTTHYKLIWGPYHVETRRITAVMAIVLSSGALMMEYLRSCVRVHMAGEINKSLRTSSERPLTHGD